VKIALVGSSGYLARHVMGLLVDQSHDVVGYQRSAPGGTVLCEIRQFPGAAQIGADLNTLGPDVVINMANLYTRSHDLRTVTDLADVNVALVGVLAEVCQSAGAILLHVGSAWQVNTKQASLGLPEAPVYGLYRGIASSIGSWYRAHRQLRYRELAIADTYGPGDPRGKLVTSLVEQAKAGDRRVQLGSEHLLMYLVHAADVASCVLRAATAEDPASDTPWLCAPEHPIRISAMVDLIGDVWDCPFEVTYAQTPARNPIASTRFEPVPGWGPSIPLIDGISGM
jgi:nucleoside-diphosphate-sugar epimerase